MLYFSALYFSAVTEMRDEIAGLKDLLSSDSHISDYISDLKNTMSTVSQELHALKSQVNSISSRVLYATNYQAMKLGQGATRTSESDDNQSAPVDADPPPVLAVSADLNSATDRANTGTDRIAGDLRVIIPARDDHQTQQAIISDDNDFQMVHRSRKRKKPVVGRKAVPPSLQSLQPVIRPRSLFVTRLPPDATAEDLTEFVAQVFKLDASCNKIVAGQYHLSFKVTVHTSHPKSLYDNSRWPEGAFVRHYYEPRERHGSQNQ